MRALVSLLVLGLACVSSITLEQALAPLVPTRPEVAAGPMDSVRALAIERAVRNGLPDFSPKNRAVIDTSTSPMAPSALPRLDSTFFYLLDTAAIAQIGYQTGYFSYLVLSAPSIAVDTAILGIASMWAGRNKTDGHRVRLPGGGCTMRFVRRGGAWAYDSTLGCVIS